MSGLDLTPLTRGNEQKGQGQQQSELTLTTKTNGIAGRSRGSKNLSHKAKAEDGEAKRSYRELTSTLLSEPDEFMAASIGDTSWLKQSLRDGRDPNSFDRNGLAPVHLAALHGRLNCLRILIEKYEVDVNLSSSTGWRPIHLTINNRIGKRSTQCLQYLLEMGADPSVMNEDSLTPAHQASIEGSVKCLNLVINAGGRTDIKDSKGHTPLDYAKIWGHRKCARIISSKNWKQEKEEDVLEMEKLQALKKLKEKEDLHREDGRMANKEFYGQLSFTNWLDSKHLPPKGTGPSKRDRNPVPWSKQPRKYIDICGEWVTKDQRGLANPNSIRKNENQPQLINLLSKLDQKFGTDKKSSKTTDRKSNGRGLKDGTPQKTAIPPESAFDCEEESPNLPDEIIERVLFDKPSVHTRPLTFKCHNIIDEQHKKIWSEDDKPLVEMYAHLSNSLDSYMFPKKEVSPSSRESLNLEANIEKKSRNIYESMKQIAKPYRFPNITGEEYKYRFEIL
ncbi:ankyrin repeat domain-containing protein 53-like [Anneissia japonica]|uniref:ankyrin repeat domain-containing protein 53-like n=1 Tax=Anneissia japonica TaxID=1529436 RepID=UPI001425ACAD|nr:ankyrin repeat domain-containing protein 53-like [Anneissia japonica]